MHRLLSIRVRRLDRVEPAAERPPLYWPLWRAAGQELRAAASRAEGRTAGSRDLAKARAYYAACTDEHAIETKGVAALAPELARVDALANARDLPPLIARLHADDGEAPGTGGAVAAAPYVFFTFLGRQDFADAATQIAVVAPAGLEPAQPRLLHEN